VQTGLAADFGSEGVRSLGAVFYEPLWVFHRAAAPMDELQDIAGRRVAIGPEGSGVRALATLLLREAGVTPDKYTASPLAGQEAAIALKAGEIDVALVVSGPTTGWIADLVGDGNIALLSMREAHALARRHGYLDEVALYRGVMDLAAVLPKEDITLIAPAAQIVVRADLHPAIQSLLIEAAFREHAGGSLLADAGRFPTPELSDIAISDEAERYYKNGPSFLRRIFPYSVANFLERAWVLVIPLVTLIIPLVRAAPRSIAGASAARSMSGTMIYASWRRRVGRPRRRRIAPKSAPSWPIFRRRPARSRCQSAIPTISIACAPISASWRSCWTSWRRRKDTPGSDAAALLSRCRGLWACDAEAKARFGYRR